MNIAEIVLPLPIDKSFSYSIPEGMEKRVKIGMRVKVPFGSRIIIGFVIKVSSIKCQVSKLKDMIEVIDEEPVVNDEMLELSRWISSYYFCPLGKVLHAVVPIKPGKKFQTGADKPSTSCSSTPGYPVPPPYKDSSPSQFFIPTSEQNCAIEFIKKNIDEKKFGAALLIGPAQSGKTEVYLHCVADVLGRGRQVLILIPEIFLTSSFIQEFRNRFGNEKIGIFHSGLSRKIHDLEWEKIRKGEVNVVIGTRSAVFSPLNNLGLIVIDGEEDYSFKEQKEPRYHVRDVAMKRAKFQNAFVILASSAPMVESYYDFGRRYRIFKFSDVFNKSPAIEIIDRKKKELKKNLPLISQEIENAIKDTISSGEKVILFLNRRGFATTLLCMECGVGFYCPNCQVPLVLHQPPSMLCHYCNYRTTVPDSCPNCGGVKLRSFGAGTQRVMNEIKKLFPEARVSRLDTDILRNRISSRDILDDFQKGKIDILVGTQMIPGEEISGVSLVGVIAVDAMLNLPDFRSTERAFQILNRLIGVLKPEKKNVQGKAIIQTHNPGHYIFQAIVSGDYQKFYEKEIKIRKNLKYPPFSHLVLLIFHGKNENKCSKNAQEVTDSLKKFVESSKYKLEIFGPAPASVPKVENKYRYQVLIKGKKTILDKCLNSTREEWGTRKEGISIDVDPIHML